MRQFIILAIPVVLLMGCASVKRSPETLPPRRLQAKESMDMRGKQITTYILFGAEQKLKNMTDGEILEIVTDNYEPMANDIKAWCRMTGRSLAGSETDTSYRRFYVVKSERRAQEKKLAMIISNPGLEELLPPLGFALAAALSGADVSIFFQGPAVRVLQKGFQEKLQGGIFGINSLFSGIARRELAAIGHVPPQEKIRQLRELGAHFFICSPSMEHFKVKKDDLIFENIVFAEYPTFYEIMSEADIHIFLQ